MKTSFLVGAVSGLAVVWWSAAVVVALNMKAVFSEVNGRAALFPHPLLFTAILNLAVGFWCVLCTQASKINGFMLCTQAFTSDSVYCALCGGSFASLSSVSLESRELLFLLLMGIFQGLELALSSSSYRYLSISENRMAMASTVVIQLFTAVLWQIERIWWLKWLAAALIAGGAAAQALDCTEGTATYRVVALACGPHNFHADPGAAAVTRTEGTWKGWVMVVSSVLISANRWALTQHIFQRSQAESAFRRWGKLQMMPYMAAGTIFVCLMLAAVFEPGAFSEFVGMGVVENLVPLVLLVSISIAILTICELLIVSMTAATVMVILAVVHNIPMILAGVIIDHDVVFRNQWLGFVLCSVGAVVYFVARNLDDQVGDVNSFVALAGSADRSRSTTIGVVVADGGSARN
ncbi:unnamed protein product [Prorocentrum cordatum]|uniref:EamA domain-containing protein n=1 Tax=Prorocentrum cordatum TaxID=2364126 RepID=A0ABN9PN90_9DINO|nr:unnamed protein product [Polarella glacialis]